MSQCGYEERGADFVAGVLRPGWSDDRVDLQTLCLTIFDCLERLPRGDGGVSEVSLHRGCIEDASGLRFA